MSRFTYINFPETGMKSDCIFDKVNRTGTPGLYARPMLVDAIREARRRDPA